MSGIEFPLETQRLLIRPFTDADAAEMHDALGDPSTFEFIDSEASADVEETRERLAAKAAHEQRHGFSMWAVVERASGRVVGECGLQMLEGSGPEVELGYKLAKAARGRGIATEAGRACLDAGFRDLGLDRIVAVAWPGNSASRHVMEKLGMTLEGTGHYWGHEAVLYAISPR